ncbi:hypothetical protein L3Q82_024393, partial [Scortum barcoo]
GNFKKVMTDLLGVKPVDPSWKICINKTNPTTEKKIKNEEGEAGSEKMDMKSSDLHHNELGSKREQASLDPFRLERKHFDTAEEGAMKGVNLSRVSVALLLLSTLSAVADAAGVTSAERGGAGRSQRRGGGGGGGGVEKRRRFHRIQHGQCSYTFILPELDGCQGGGSASQTEQYGGSRSRRGESVVQRDSPPADGEWSAQKLQRLESTMVNNTQWLQKSFFGFIVASAAIWGFWSVNSSESVLFLTLGDVRPVVCDKLYQHECLHIVSSGRKSVVDLYEEMKPQICLISPNCLQGLQSVSEVQQVLHLRETQGFITRLNRQMKTTRAYSYKQLNFVLIFFHPQLENVIQKSMKPDISNVPPHVVHNQTATMLEIGTNLLTHTAEQTRKLNVVEAKVLNHTSRIEIQLLENSLSTNKLEKELLLQTSEISRLRDKNSRLESKVQKLESQQKGELEDMRQEKNRLQGHLPGVRFGGTVQSDAYKAGHSVSGLYQIYISNRTEPVQVYCDMDTDGGGWTVFQRRFNGSVDFQRSWREYKMGFGDVFGEHWLGNEALHLLTSQGQYSLRVELRDWEGNSAHSKYDRFTLTNERQQYRLYLRGYSGTAGRQSSLTTHGTGFSTRDLDNDNCDHCKCALMLTGGWWFDACGFSNLNGIYYTVGQNIRKLNGIKWHHFRGPSYSLRSTSMMVRPRLWLIFIFVSFLLRQVIHHVSAKANDEGAAGKASEVSPAHCFRSVPRSRHCIQGEKMRQNHYTVTEPRKRAYADFYKQYDAVKEFNAMREAGVFESVRPSGE